MKRPANRNQSLIEPLFITGEDGPPLEDKVAHAQKLRSTSKDLETELDFALLSRIESLHGGLAEARETMHNLEGVIEKLTVMPWHPAVFLGLTQTQRGLLAVVQLGATRRVVGFAEGAAPELFRCGDEVFLGPELNVIMAKSSTATITGGEIACFDRITSEKRLVLNSRDQEVIVHAASPLLEANLKRGDMVRFDRTSWIAFERIEAAEGHQSFLNETPNVSSAQVGGQDANLQTLLDALTTFLIAPDLAASYDVGGRQTVLLHGPPGCGKTLMARVGCSEIQRLSGKKCRFAVVKPAEWEDPFVGVTQQNIRNFFKALQEAAKEGFAVAFLDEIEAAGRIRGSAVGHHSDKFLAALLAEIDGFKDRKNVAIISATNRKDLVDPALLERLSDIEIPVDRPDSRGARGIFQVHLTPTLPYNPNGSSAATTREDLIEIAVSKLYSPNADNEVCTVKFRDNKQRVVVARELASGRIFEQVARAARRAAFLRHARGGEPGLCAADVEEAVAQAIDRMRTMLTRHNVHAYLSDLPQDVDVVSCQPVVRKVPRPHRYLHAA
ncbi:MAG: AAA family ATPase [Verrucomicrobia bacterium]|nr:AAA family ATPase [Verrucomicrobiota bacterium]